MIRHFSNFLFFVFLFFLSFGRADAASFSFSAPGDTISVGTPFALELRINAEGEKINTLSGRLVFSNTFFTLDHVDTSDSIISNWIDDPEESKKEIFFSGIIAGGFDGLIDPFLPEEVRPAPVFTAYFIPKKSGYATIHLEDGKVFLADGVGTEQKNALYAYSFDILPATDDKKNIPPKNLSKEILVIILVGVLAFLYRKFNT